MRQPLLAIVLTALVAVPLQAQSSATPPLRIQSGPYKLSTSIFQGSHLSAHPVLVVILHGDAPFNKPDYQYRFAAGIAEADSDVVVAAILRPGYTDPAGNTSEGDRGQSTGDNYNVRNVDAIAEAMGALRLRFKPRRLVVVGHSGGAAITADILGRRPALIDVAVLVSCPCDVVQWRQHMLEKTGFDGFRGPVETLSPIDQISEISDRVFIQMIVGDKDDIAPLALSEAYQTAVSKLGRQIQLQRLSGEGHEILLTPAVRETVRSLLDSIARAAP